MRATSIFLVFSIINIVLISCNKKTTSRLPVKELNTATTVFESGRLWKDTYEKFSPPSCTGKIYPLRYRMLDVDTAMVRKFLVVQGNEPGKLNLDTLLIEIPYPDGTWESFRISQVQVMAPELAAKYPFIKTYSGNAKLYPADQIRIEVSPDGLRVMVLSVKGTMLIDPYCNNDKVHMISYLKKDMPEGAKEEFERK